jgi:hypothetical protein
MLVVDVYRTANLHKPLYSDPGLQKKILTFGKDKFRKPAKASSTRC